MGKRGGTSTARPQVEHLEERRRREACEKLSENAPAGAFSDDPRADGYDRHGKTLTGSNSNLMLNRWDLGGFPPND